jgi:hypothetical protein
MFAATTILPNSLGDVWSVLFALIAFAVLFAFLKLLDRV